MPKPRRLGRPEGAKNIDTVVDVIPPACPLCGSTEKTYTGTRSVQEHEGTHNGRPFNRIVRRRCVCGNPGCVQTRIERSYEFEPPDERGRRKK